MSRKLKYNENQYKNFIYENTTEASRYEQVAEEATELAHAALKVARILRGKQPVAEDITLESVIDHLIEEFADVELTMWVTDLVASGHPDIDDKFCDVFDEKILRWYERIKEKTGKGIEEYEEEIRRSIYSGEGTEKTEVKEDACNSRETRKS